MIHNLKPYPEYKDSGVPWLGEVPEHWEVKRLKQVCTRSALYGANIAASSYSPTGIRFLRTTDIREDGTLKSGGVYIKSEDALGYLLEDGDILISRSGTVGRSFLYNNVTHGSCAYAGYLVRFVLGDTFLPKFLLYFTRTPSFADFLKLSSIQSTIENVNGDKYANSLVPVPSLPEQSAIIRYLNHMDKRIRRYIRIKQKLIKLLEEQKQATIHQAVTRGLDPNVKLKPSGVEWLGDVPEHWEVRRNGQLFVQRNQTGFAELPILEVSLKTGIRVRDFENTNRKQVMSDREKYKRAVKGDIAYNMMRMWQGAVGVAPVDGLVSPAYVVAKPLEGVDPRYYSNLFRTSVYMNEVDRCSRGIVKDRNRLYWEDFKQIHSPCPPFEEQIKIANAIYENTQAVNHTIEQVMQEISLLREYRTRLIADVVTGKLDVREAAANLPEEAEETEPLDDSVADDELENDEMKEQAGELEEEILA